MGINNIAEKRAEHFMIAGGPDLIVPPACTTPVPCITLGMFDTAKKTTKRTRANGYPIFTSVSFVPHCIGGIPGGKGVKSGKWNGKYWANEYIKSINVEEGKAVRNNHGAKGNG